jgi:hypothetical protein
LLELASVVHNCIDPLTYFSLIRDYLFNETSFVNIVYCCYSALCAYLISMEEGMGVLGLRSGRLMQMEEK